MKLELNHLKERHEYWKQEIGKAGIWEAERFLPVIIEIRKKHRRYHALFHRRVRRGTNGQEVVDRIRFYENSEDFLPEFIDNVLVHEMIHQYMFQNNIKDSSPHGKVFKNYMNVINRSFAGRLKIRVHDTNPCALTTGRGEESHLLAIISKKDYLYCCVINKARKDFFERLMKRYRSRGVIEEYSWKKSADVFFSLFSRCTKVLHGEKVKKEDAEDYFKRHFIEDGD